MRTIVKAVGLICINALLLKAEQIDELNLIFQNTNPRLQKMLSGIY